MLRNLVGSYKINKKMMLRISHALDTRSAEFVYIFIIIFILRLIIIFIFKSIMILHEY